MKTFVISYIVWLTVAAGGIALWRTRSDDAARVEPAKRPVASAPQAPQPSQPLEQRLRQAALSGPTALHLIPDSMFQLVDDADLATIVEAVAAVKNWKDDSASPAVLQGLLARWFELDREGAFSFILELEPQTASLAAGLLSDWADRDTAACLTWAKGPGARLVQAAFGNHETLAEVDRRLFALLEPGECMKKAAALLKSGPRESGQLITAMARWREDAAARRDFLDRLAQNKLRRAGAFAYWAAIDVSGLQALLPSPPDDDTDGSHNTVMQAVMNTGPGSPEPAAAWRMSMAGKTESKRWILGRIVSAWMESGKDGLESWIETQPDPADRDAAQRAVATGTIRINNEAAVACAERISDPALRLQTLHTVIRAWQREDPLAAAAFLSRAPWPEESKNTLALMCLCPSARQ